MGAKWVRNPNLYHANYSVMANFYDEYEKKKADAIALDSRVSEYRKAEIAQADQDFATPFVAIRDPWPL